MDVPQALEQYGGRVFLTLSVVFIYVGILTMSSMGSWESATSFLLSVTFILVGFGIQYQWFTNMRSKEGIGTLLFCVSVMILATSAVLLLFRDFVKPDLSQLPPGGEYVLIFKVIFPYADFARIFFLIGVTFFIAGAIIRMRSQ